jgi:hypothetical protein
MSRKFPAAFAALTMSCASADATPVISGTYVIRLHTFCQPILTAHFNGSVVVDNLQLSQNEFDQQLLTGEFNDKKGKVTVSGFRDAGSAIVLKWTGASSGQSGSALAENPVSATLPYSWTDSSFTVNGETYHAVLGAVDKKNIAHSVWWLGSFVEGGATCSGSGEATLQ